MHVSQTVRSSECCDMSTSAAYLIVVGPAGSIRVDSGRHVRCWTTLDSVILNSETCYTVHHSAIAHLKVVCQRSVGRFPLTHLLTPSHLTSQTHVGLWQGKLTSSLRQVIADPLPQAGISWPIQERSSDPLTKFFQPNSVSRTTETRSCETVPILVTAAVMALQLEQKLG
jgi:hypothetical protein